MQVTVTFPHGEIDSFSRLVFLDQMPFATSQAINATAKAFQADMRERLRDIFTIRRDVFADRSIKIKPFATKDSLSATISVAPPPASKSPAERSDIFGKFEDESEKVGLGGSIAVPTEHVPRTGSGVIRAAWRPRRVLDRNFRDGFRAFITERAGGKRAIFFDEGDRIVPLYWLVPSVDIEPELEFVDTAVKTVNRVWEREFVSAFDRATRTAR
jgi:hypothetical protein